MASSQNDPIMVCVRTPTGKILRISVVIPDSSSRVVRELAAIEHEPLPLVRVYFKDIQLKHDLTPVDAAHGREPDYQALTMETAIQIFVFKQGSREFGCETRLNIEPSDAVDDVKQKIQSAEGIPSIQQRLVFAGRPILDGKKRFSELGFPRKCSLFIDLYVLETKIAIISQHGGIYELFVASSDTIEAVKHSLELKVGAPKERLRLFFAGFELNDCCTISGANVKHGATMQLVMSMHCGHCRGLPGICACKVCPRPLGSRCLVPLHCTHCRGLNGPCACGKHCVRPSESFCWPGHCVHCKGNHSLCACDLCPRPDTALCNGHPKRGVMKKDAGDRTPLMQQAVSKLE